MEAERSGAGRRWHGGRGRQQLHRHLRASDDRAALIRTFLDGAVLADRLREGADPQVAHQHSIVAGAVQAWLVRDDSVAFVVVLVVVVAS